MQISLFDYNLPKELIAQKPMYPRDQARLLILDKKNGQIDHRHFYDLLDILDQDDVLILNETKVFPARLIGQKKTGGKIEVFLTEKISDDIYQAMIGGRRAQLGDMIYFKNLECKIIKKLENKLWQVKFDKSGDDLDKAIEDIGSTPLPPYIKTQDSEKIKQDYQTVFARHRGSVAAPTAGLHFTEELLEKIKAKNIKIFKITLHVSLGTFKPVDVEDIREYKIHHEWASIDDAVVQELNKLKKAGKNIIAVGTTTARTLEAFTDKAGNLSAGQKWVDIYIYPGYKFRFIDSLITNFHLPKSSLLFLVSALAGRENILNAYQEAIKLKYRFYSFGDAMIIR